MSVIGGVTSSTNVLTRMRWPSEVTSYGYASSRARRGRAWNRVRPVPTSKREVGEGVAHLPGVEPRHFSRRVTRCRHLNNRTRWIAHKENDPLTAPGAADADRRSCQGSDQATIEIEPLQKPIRKERHGAAIWRPERKHRTAGSDQRARHDRVDGTHPHMRPAVRVGDEQNLPSVSGQRGG
jgi:hypothetical protein